MNTATTREQLLNHAQILIRQRGYNGFSYRDLAEHVGVKTASIHYYFPTKEDLLLEVVNDYAARVSANINAIDESLSAKDQLDRYAQLFANAPSDQICLCGTLAADLASLSERSRQTLQAFYRVHEAWLAKVMARAQVDGTLKTSGDCESDGRWLFAAFQGGLMSSRLFQNASRLNDVMASVQVSGPTAQPDAHPAAA
ncbi:MAG: TetR/AcrR family transcriptional regulator [Achromobacter sp.]|jgi:TetR/AcrR family transcriptional repressor of nem operon